MNLDSWMKVVCNLYVTCKVSDLSEKRSNIEKSWERAEMIYKLDSNDVERNWDCTQLRLLGSNCGNKLWVSSRNFKGFETSPKQLTEINYGSSQFL